MSTLIENLALSKDHHPSKPLPENPEEFTSAATADPRARLQAHINGHSVAFSRSTCQRSTERGKQGPREKRQAHLDTGCPTEQLRLEPSASLASGAAQGSGKSMDHLPGLASRLRLRRRPAPHLGRSLSLPVPASLSNREGSASWQGALHLTALSLPGGRKSSFSSPQTKHQVKYSLVTERKTRVDLTARAAGLAPSLLGLAADEEKCRHIRRQYRQLIYTVQQNREDIVNTPNDSLTEALEEANVLFDEVSRTREAALDAQFLVLASDLGKEKAKQLNSDVSLFNQSAFCDLLFTFVGLNWMEDERGELSGFDDKVVLSFWERMQKEAAAWMLQAETFRFMLGSFKAEPCARRPRHPKKVRKAEENGSMPTKLRKLDLSSNAEATEKEVERILGLLQTCFQKYPDSPVSYFEFVIDPNSFSRTVENIFYVSFIIRDGFARIRLDQDRLPILEPTTTNQVDEGNDPGFYDRKQGIISLTLQDWKNIVATFEISEAMISNTY
ncbi:EP300-interacting inhibitor of differentiation 3 [Carlito syrichta]|uniref:Non-structural maintenance of chromosomes element 4 n=1 Tax=Carlito syrichta TaxID=1868482 RepID=A0A3Q0E2Z6_CARSF|nr:EP300-interacting inhibitor of differentiation 3 [Carlito syrichta]